MRFLSLLGAFLDLSFLLVLVFPVKTDRSHLHRVIYLFCFPCQQTYILGVMYEELYIFVFPVPSTMLGAQ